jgi:hypothetical protein
VPVNCRSNSKWLSQFKARGPPIVWRPILLQADEGGRKRRTAVDGPQLALSWPNLPCALKAAIGIGKRTLGRPSPVCRAPGRRGKAPANGTENLRLAGTREAVGKAPMSSNPFSEKTTQMGTHHTGRDPIFEPRDAEESSDSPSM